MNRLKRAAKLNWAAALCLTALALGAQAQSTGGTLEKIRSSG